MCCRLRGSVDRIEIEIPFNISPQRETRVFLGSGGVPPIASATETETAVFSAVDQYTIEVVLLEHAVAEDGDVAVPV